MNTTKEPGRINPWGGIRSASEKRPKKWGYPGYPQNMATIYATTRFLGKMMFIRMKNSVLGGKVNFRIMSSTMGFWGIAIFRHKPT